MAGLAIGPGAEFFAEVGAAQEGGLGRLELNRIALELEIEQRKQALEWLGVASER